MKQKCVIVILAYLPDFIQNRTENLAKTFKYPFLTRGFCKQNGAGNVFMNKSNDKMISQSRNACTLMPNNRGPIYLCFLIFIWIKGEVGAIKPV